MYPGKCAKSVQRPVDCIGINTTPGLKDKMTNLAGQPRVKLVFDILVWRSNISTSCALSTAGSHSCLSSGVVITAFHASRGADWSVIGTSRTTLYTFSPDLVALRCTTTSVSSGFVEARDFPLLGEESLANEICFHSEEE